MGEPCCRAPAPRPREGPREFWGLGFRVYILVLAGIVPQLRKGFEIQSVQKGFGVSGLRVYRHCFQDF